MELGNKNSLTASETTYILVGTMVGIGILGLPGTLAQKVYQDAWIAAGLGAFLPLYYAALGYYLCKWQGDKDVLVLCTNYFGPVFGRLLNLGFLGFFMLNLIAVLSGFSNLFRLYATPFLPSIKVILLTCTISAYTATRGLKTLGKINQIAFFLSILMFLLCVEAFRKGSYYNVMPIMQAPIIEIVKSTKDSLFSYCGMELFFILYPFMENRKNVGSLLIKAVTITFCLYTIVTFLTIYYMGPEMVVKSSWPVVSVFESIQIPIINSFRFIFTMLWVIIALKSISNYHFASLFTLSNIIGEKKVNTINIAVFSLSVILAMQLTNETVRRAFLDKIMPVYTLCICLYFTIIFIFSWFKRGEGIVKASKK